MPIVKFVKEVIPVAVVAIANKQADTMDGGSGV
jgi:hypothetical protein